MGFDQFLCEQAFGALVIFAVLFDDQRLAADLLFGRAKGGFGDLDAVDGAAVLAGQGGFGDVVGQLVGFQAGLERADVRFGGTDFFPGFAAFELRDGLVRFDAVAFAHVERQYPAGVFGVKQDKIAVDPAGLRDEVFRQFFVVDGLEDGDRGDQQQDSGDDERSVVRHVTPLARFRTCRG